MRLIVDFDGVSGRRPHGVIRQDHPARAMPDHLLAQEAPLNATKVAMNITMDDTTATSAGRYSYASADTVRIRLAFRQRTAAYRWRRHVVMVMDAAIDQCERHNLAAPDELRGSANLQAPDLVASLVEQLQADLGLRIRRPRSNQDALDTLFDLQLFYMPNTDQDEEETLI